MSTVSDKTKELFEKLERARQRAELTFSDRPPLERRDSQDSSYSGYNSSTRSTEEINKPDHSEEGEEQVFEEEEEEVTEEDVADTEEEEHAPVEQVQAPMAETIRQLSNPTGGGVAPLCIAYPEPGEGLNDDFELKSGFLHHLPKFHGMSSEDTNKHLKEFEFVCGSMCPKGADINIFNSKSSLSPSPGSG